MKSICVLCMDACICAVCVGGCILRIPDQNGISRLYIMVEMYKCKQKCVQAPWTLQFYLHGVCITQKLAETNTDKNHCSKWKVVKLFPKSNPNFLVIWWPAAEKTICPCCSMSKHQSISGTDLLWQDMSALRFNHRSQSTAPVLWIEQHVEHEGKTALAGQATTHHDECWAHRYWWHKKWGARHCCLDEQYSQKHTELLFLRGFLNESQRTAKPGCACGQALDQVLDQHTWSALARLGGRTNTACAPSWECMQHAATLDRLVGLVVKAVLNWKRTFARAQQAPLFLNWPREHFMVLGFCSYSIHGSVRLQIEAPEEKPYLTRWRYTDPGETRKICWEWQWQHIGLRARQEEQASGKEKDTDFGCMCVGIRRKYQRDAENRNLFGNPACKLSVHTHTPTHFITHDRFKAQHTRKGQQKCDVYSLRNGCDPLISWLPHTVRAEPRAACEIKQKIGHRFSISKWPEGSRTVLCGPHTLFITHDWFKAQHTRKVQ